MFGFLDARKQLIRERQKNAALEAQIAKTNSDIEYLAMMADVEMEQEDEQEVKENGEEE